mmetsp:Transcript_21700/g.43060  ORF Transcript_21700/g.43060 Transcript_21700/m.43060 type:complete len:214 (+) Transcript_21700:39-680(+)
MVFQRLFAIPKRHPFAFQLGFATVKTAAADYLVQRTMEKKKHSEVDWKRNLVFTAFGGAYLGGFQWLIYVTMFRRWFPHMDKFASQTLKEKMKNRPGQIDLAKQVGFDNFIHYTFIYFPTFYIFKESIQGDKNSTNPFDIIKGGLQKYQKNFWGDNTAIWAMWIPADIVIYAIPIWMRLPANHALSFVWTCILSFMRGDSIEEAPAQIEEIKE